VLSTCKQIVFHLISKKYRRFLYLCILIMLIAGALTNVPAVILGFSVDFLLSKKDANFTNVMPFIFYIIAAILIREILTVARKYIIENTCTQVAKQEKVKLIDHLLRVDLRFLKEMMAGSLQGRITRSLEGLIRLLKLMFLDFFPVFFTAIAALVFAFIKSPLMGILMTGVIPTGFLIIFWQVHSQKGIRIQLLRANEDMDGKVVELLTSLESVRAMNTEAKEVFKVEAKAEVLRAKEIKHHWQMALFDSLKTINEGFFYIAVIIFSLYFAFKGAISKGDILTYSVLYLSVMNPLREMHRILDESHESYLRVQDLINLKSIPKDISFGTIKTGKSLLQVSDKTPIIEVKNLSFSYDEAHDRKRIDVLRNVSCVFHKGQRIGLAGPSGCGKSTFIKIILRLLHYKEGEILLNGVSLKNFSRDKIALKFGYVQQQPLIMSGTIHDNIEYGFRDKFSFEDVTEAAKNAQIHDEILKNLGGYYGLVQERGKNLSGGQKQRIAISRLFLYQPEILILDEATAALDNINEKLVQDGLNSMMKERTVIMVAHRLSTLTNCDQIFVFNKGEIVETGDYRRLINKKGLFHRLHTVAQALEQ